MTFSIERYKAEWAIRVPRFAPISVLTGRRGNAFIDPASS